MKSLVQKIILSLLFGIAVLPAHAFNSLYVFGDSLSSTTDGTTSPYYYPGRDSNGHVWVEVLAQRQGIAYDATKNNSYYDHDSAEVVSDVLAFKPPADVANDLFVVWVCNADVFNSAQNPDSSLQWTLDNTVATVNNLAIITGLYAKGVRTLIMPNAVDISTIPAFNAGTKWTAIEHAGCIGYNTALANTINSARLLCPGLTIYTPDYYTLLNNMLTNAPAYGLTNALSRGLSIDALDDFSIPNLTLNGMGTNYIFWDAQDPTAKLHEIIADVAQQMISPVQIGKLTPLNNGSNQLDVVNYPAGLSGFVDGTTNLALPNWTSVASITSSNIAQSFIVPTNGSSQFVPNVDINPIGGTGSNGAPVIVTAQFYRLRFPYAWKAQ